MRRCLVGSERAAAGRCLRLGVLLGVAERRVVVVMKRVAQLEEGWALKVAVGQAKQ